MNTKNLIEISTIINDKNFINCHRCHNHQCCTRPNCCAPKPCCNNLKSTDPEIQKRIISNMIKYINDNKSFNLFMELMSNKELLNEIYPDKDLK